MTQSVNSLRDLHRLKLRLDGPVQVTKTGGGFFRARFRGKAQSVFGSTPEEAKARLLKSTEKFRTSRTHRRSLQKVSLKELFSNYEGKGTSTYEVCCGDRDKQ